METEETGSRVVGDYIVGPQRVGSGSFSVVWRGRDRRSGGVVAVKEIDKKILNSKVEDSLLKEITILRQVSHPNIVRLHQAIQTEDKIYLILEYCTGGDLATYIHRHGRVSEAVARHFMRQLASGLQVLRDNNLIHRDLKPQNLLLCTKDETPVLKIGDFGFARYLMPQGLADTLCGSPLYMAPEIIQNKKYDAKADLWSVGAILFQLVTGKPPFEGNTQLQLFQNVLASGELQFPQDILIDLSADCINLCKSLLRRNPVERLTFEEFFNHKFMTMLRLCLSHYPKHRQTLSHENSSTLLIASLKKMLTAQNILPDRPSGNASEFTQNTAIVHSRNIFGEPSDSVATQIMKNGAMKQGFLRESAPKVSDSVESIEQDYVLVHAHFASMETLSSSLESSLRENSTAKLLSYTQKSIGTSTSGIKQSGELDTNAVCGVESVGSQMSTSSSMSQASSASVDVAGPSSLNPSSRLKILCHYVYILTELAQEKLHAGLHLVSFSVELVALPVWKEALRICNLWISSTAVADTDNSFTSSQKDERLPQNLSAGLDFSRPLSVCAWVERGFILACDRAEKISNSFRDIDGNLEMPDAMEIIFQTALSTGRSGAVDVKLPTQLNWLFFLEALVINLGERLFTCDDIDGKAIEVDELMGHRNRAVASYSKAITLLTFILVEASSLPLNPPFFLSSSDHQRLHRYMINLRSHLNRSQMVEQHVKHHKAV